jgi:hypothetical protein
MKLVRSFLLTVRLAPHWLAEREAIRCENKLIDLLRVRRGLGQPLAAAKEIELYAEENRLRSEEIDGSGVRRLIGWAYDIQLRSPAALRLGLRLVWRGFRTIVMAVSGGRDKDAQALRSPPSIAPTIAIPFDASFPRSDLAGPVGAIIHVFYPELMPEIRGYLENIPGRTDVYISTDSEAKRAVLEQAMAGWPRGSVEVRIAPNRGRDIAPKLITFRDIYDRHPVVLHLHSKKSPHDSILRLWRYFLYETLIGSPRAVSDILAAFALAPRLGFVAPQHYFPLKAGIVWSENLVRASALAERMGMAINERAPLDFPAGSMFWARSDALRPLLDLGLSADDFPAESGQEDFTLAHAIERLYFHACELAGLSWIKICRSPLAHALDGELIEVRRAEDVQALVERARPMVREATVRRPASV